MATIKIPGLRPKPTSAGIRYYWEPSATLKRAGWTPVALGMEQGPAIAAAQAKNAEVAAWRAGGQADRRLQNEIQKFSPRSTLGALIKRYTAERLPEVGAGTQKGYRTALVRLDEWAGDTVAAAITPKNVQSLQQQMLTGKKAIGHHAAFNVLKVGRILYGWAKEPNQMLVQNNPFDKFALTAPAARNQLWETDDEGAFCAAAIDKGYPSMAFAAQLAIYTAQRSQDLIAFTENDLEQVHLFDPQLTQRFAGTGNTVMGWSLVQKKTRTAMVFPFDPAMLARLQKVLKDNRARDRTAGRLITHVLVDDTTGLPWTQHGFIRAWQMILKHAVKRTGRAKMADLHWHDFRRTRVVRLRRRGMNREQISSLTGHSPKSIDAMLLVYGPVDPTMTASVIGAMVDYEAADAAAAKKRKAKG